MGRLITPQREASKRAPAATRNRLGTRRCMPHVVIRLAKDHAADAARLDLFDRIKQVRLGGNAEHNQIAPIFGQVKPASGFQASVANLDDLVGKGARA